MMITSAIAMKEKAAKAKSIFSAKGTLVDKGTVNQAQKESKCMLGVDNGLKAMNVPMIMEPDCRADINLSMGAEASSGMGTTPRQSIPPKNERIANTGRGIPSKKEYSFSMDLKRGRRPMAMMVPASIGNNVSRWQQP